MAAETNTITTSVLTNAQIRELDFTLRFNESIKKLIEALGVTRKIAKEAGTTLKTYKASGTLVDGTTALEGEVIPLSKYKVEPVSYKDIKIKKYRKATTIEAIAEYGYDQAHNMTSDRMLKDVQKVIRKDFFDFLHAAGVADSSTGKTSGTVVTESGLQAVLAMAWGNLKVLFDDDEVEAVHFINPLDIASYLKTATITTQTAFGMDYIENFLGLGTVFLNSSVTQGEVYTTAKENIVLYYIAVNGADIGEAFNFTSDESGYIGIHENASYNNLTDEDVVIDGIELFAEREDGIIVGKINP